MNDLNLKDSFCIYCQDWKLDIKINIWKEKRVKIKSFRIYYVHRVTLEHPITGIPCASDLFCNSLIRYWPSQSSGCAYGQLKSIENLQMIRVPTYFTCDESHYCGTKCWPSPFLKNRLAKTGRREAVRQSTSSRTLPQPLPSFQMNIQRQPHPPDSALGMEGH